MSDLHLLLLECLLYLLNDLYDLKVGFKICSGHMSVLNHAIGAFNSYTTPHRLSLLRREAKKAERVATR